jgi:hypothetical protein
MQNFANVITSALSYYDNSLNTYSKLLKYKRQLVYDNEKNSYVVRFINKKREVVFVSKCEIIGKYDLLNGYWMWAWADNSYDSHLIQYSKKILNYGLNLDNSKLRDHFINSKIFLNSNAQIDIHIALILYILKKPLIIPISWTRTVDDVLMENYNVKPIRLNFFVVPTEMTNYESSIKRSSNIIDTSSKNGNVEDTETDVVEEDSGSPLSDQDQI